MSQLTAWFIDSIDSRLLSFIQDIGQWGQITFKTLVNDNWIVNLLDGKSLIYYIFKILDQLQITMFVQKLQEWQEFYFSSELLEMSV